MHKCLQMGCLSSRSTTVSPIDLSESNGNTNDLQQTASKKPFNVDGRHKQPKDNKHQRVVNDHLKAPKMSNQRTNRSGTSDSGVGAIGDAMAPEDGLMNRATNKLNQGDEDRMSADDDIMSILMNDQDRSTSVTSNRNNNNDNGGEPGAIDSKTINVQQQSRLANETSLESPELTEESNMNRRDIENLALTENQGELSVQANYDRGDQRNEQSNGNSDHALATVNQQDKSIEESSFDEDLNVELLKQYIVVDYEITQLEDRDALRIYHEKIEQLEQLERELDMISMEAEEVAARGSSTNQFQMPNMSDFTTKAIGGAVNDGESNSILSGITESVSPKSSLKRGNNNNNNNANQNNRNNNYSLQHQFNGSNKSSIKRRPNNSGNNNNNDTTIGSELVPINASINNNSSANSSNNKRNSSYSTVEEVFNRKIILEKERDKLKKEVEMVIIECDKLQNRYKKRDEILDKLFDGRTGNGLENHLEQQLNWLMEQKHYVDQVFYAWKRAETLTSQTCEQFSSALELLKRLTKTQDELQRIELAKNIGQLLLKSRQDMEQAQRYNPNVDAPFFTDTETERFDKIIDTISSSQTINQNDYSQIATVIQFAYKRAVSIRLWLEQILQITIARDSFELAEEYKWIAIQLRKERITLIKSKLRDPPYRAMAQSIQEQLAKQSKLSITGIPATNNELAKGTTEGQATGEVNRDSGIESDDIDIEEEIYRLLEMNKSRLEAAVAAGGSQLKSQQQDSSKSFQQVKPNGQQFSSGSNINQTQHNNNNQQQRHPLNDQMMRERIERRVRGEQSLAIASRTPLGAADSTGSPAQLSKNEPNATNTGKLVAPNDSQQSDLTSSTTMTSTTTISNGQTVGSGTPLKLRVELDEVTRQNLLKQVDQTHEKHRSKMERLRGNNRAKASDSIMNRVQQARRQQQQQIGDKSTINLGENWDGLV